MNFESIKYDFNPEFAKMNLNLVSIKNRKAINGTTEFLEDITGFKLSIWIKSVQTKGRPWTLFNVSLDGCDFIENKWGKLNLISSVTLKEIKKSFGGLPPRCPMKKVCLKYPIH